jgi:phytoene dehydrogenase-like protein
LNESYDGIVVGAGPNGLAAAIRLAQAGLSVLVVEANETLGGGTRSAELTLPGFIHDLCSAVHPMAAGSPFFRQLDLEKFGLAWIEPGLPLAHPLSAGQAVTLDRSVATTARGLGGDGTAYERLMHPLISDWEILATEFLQPLLHWPDHPLKLARFGLRAMNSAVQLTSNWFQEERAKALFAGLAGHSFLPLETIPSAAFGLVLAMMGHAVGWPSARGGSQQICNALASVLRSLGGELQVNWRVAKLDELPKARVVLLDITPCQLLRIAGDHLPTAYAKRLSRFEYGPGIFKIDYALNGPIPWSAEACRRAGTVHVCGRFEEVALAEREVNEGRHPERPFVLLAQPSLFDSTRAPHGKQVAWAYCHVPNGSSVDMTRPMEDQIERFATGFRERVLARHTSNCPAIESKNANLVGGSINGGAVGLWQMLARPILSPAPYRVPRQGLYLCSSSTPPGGGVHGMCGFHAAEVALRDWFS